MTRSAAQREAADDVDATKRCISCGSEKPVTDFHIKISMKSGRCASCKVCVSVRSKELREANADIVKIKQHANRIKNRSAINAGNRARYAANPELYKERVKAAYVKNLEKIKVRELAYRAANDEKIKARDRVWRENNRERHRAGSRTWAKENPEKRKARDAVRRARLLAAEGIYTCAEIKSLIKMQKGKCAYCKRALKDNYHADHIMPLALGGTNWIKNIQLTCRLCNLQKNSSHPVAFAQSRGLLL